MRNGDGGSRTAVYVTLGRAAADGRTNVPRFSDPIARSLLPAQSRDSLERYRAGLPARTSRERFLFGVLERMERMMPVRTVAIDDALRERAPIPQLVILGAGFDARAWRIPELAPTIVYEVDHPSTQATKRDRIAAAARSPLAREVRFVAVDFRHDRLEDALARAGHDVGSPTVWIWEGVISYLTREAVAATLGVVAGRSAPRSRLIATYNTRIRGRLLFRLFLRAIGEPHLSAHSTEEMRALLEAKGFAVASDASLVTCAERLAGPDAAAHLERWRGSHVLVADRT